MSTFLRIVRDPAWQAVGVIVAVVGIFISTASITKNSGLAVIYSQTVKFREYWLPSKQIKVQVRGTSEDINRLQVDYFFVLNATGKPILPTDFVSPLTVTKARGVKRLLAVEQCANQRAVKCSPVADSNGPTYVDLTWSERGKENWSTIPTLINRQDQSCVLLIYERDVPGTEGSPAERFSWGGRIVDANLEVFDSIPQFQATNGRPFAYYLLTSVTLFGFGVYWFILLQLVLFVGVIYLALRACWIAKMTRRQVLRVSMVAFLSITSAEILVDIFINKRVEAPIVWPLLGLHLILCGYLVYRVITRAPRTA